ncbi:MAG: CocE/NonD family hydrolase [Polyangiales bacterium]
MKRLPGWLIAWLWLGACADAPTTEPLPVATGGRAGADRVSRASSGVGALAVGAGTGVNAGTSAGATAPATPSTAGMDGTAAISGQLSPAAMGGRDAANAGGQTDGGSDEPRPDCTAFMSAGPRNADATATPYPGGLWTVPERTHGTDIETGVEITMSDGAVLVGDVSYPTDLTTGTRATGSFPVILTLNPYGSGAFGPQYGEIFVTHGYIFATVDVRGTSRSGGGPQELFSPRDADDGAELVTWASKLEGADGRIGLQGCSQLGINQLETASRLGPDSPVKAMIPACPSGDFYRDTAFDNGVPSITAQALVPDAAMGADTAYYREYWQLRDRVARAPTIARTGIPALLWSGWHEPGALGALELYTVLQNVRAGRPPAAPITSGQAVSGHYQVIIGDWAHGGGLDLGIELQWYDTWIKGIDTGLPIVTETPLHIAELGGTKRWLNARCYPMIERYTARFLAREAKLSEAADSGETQATLQWVPQILPAEPLEYVSEPFSSGALLAGPISARLQVTSSNTNVQLYIEVLDRAPDGTLAQISAGSIIGALRRTDPEKSWFDPSGLPMRPYLTLDQDQPLTPNEKTALVVPLGTKVWSIEPNHRLVVRVAAHPPDDACIGVIVPPVGCYPTTPMVDALRGGEYTLHIGGPDGSLVSLPLLAHGAFQTVEPSGTPTGDPDSPLPIDW